MMRADRATDGTDEVGVVLLKLKLALSEVSALSEVNQPPEVVSRAFQP